MSAHVDISVAGSQKYNIQEVTLQRCTIQGAMASIAVFVGDEGTFRWGPKYTPFGNSQRLPVRDSETFYECLYYISGTAYSAVFREQFTKSKHYAYVLTVDTVEIDDETTYIGKLEPLHNSDVAEERSIVDKIGWIEAMFPSRNTSLETLVTQADWEEMAKHAGVSPDELRTTLLDVFNDEENLTPVSSVPTISEVSVEGSCRKQSFGVKLYKAVELQGVLTLCGDKLNWSATLDLSLEAKGLRIWTHTFHFSLHSVKRCFDVNVQLTKADACVQLELKPHKVSLNISGKVCVRNWKLQWSCKKFNFIALSIPVPWNNLDNVIEDNP